MRDVLLRLLPLAVPFLLLGATSCGSSPQGTGGSGTSSTTSSTTMSSSSNGSGAATGTTSATGGTGGSGGSGGTGGAPACDPIQCGGLCKGDVCTRDVPCSPAPLGQPGDKGSLQDPAFLAGLVDLEFDPACTAWGVTIISGPDFLRSVAPDGKVGSFPGVTNLDMGEVSVLQNYATGPGQPPVGVDVAISYVCCSSCGCQLQSTPQGVSHFDPQTGALPLVIPSMTSTDGKGPFGSIYLDTGPSGLTYGTDHVLYVGNIDKNGDYYRLDLTTNTKTLFTTLPSRVYASAPFDEHHMLVALEGGDIRLLSLTDATSSVFATSPVAVTGMVRDFFEGSIYVARTDGQIWKYDPKGDGALAWTAKSHSRITVAPDGYLYALEITPGVANETPSVERWQLPMTK